jgi:threonine dehydrogenase-like Zn-dependent dehydrogenase
MPHLLEHIRAGRIDAQAIISHRVPLESAADAYRIFEKKEDNCIKCVLVPAGVA